MPTELESKMLHAKGLIRDKKYQEARRFLTTIDHPIAMEWISKIDQIEAKLKKPLPPVKREIPFNPEAVKPIRKSQQGIEGVLWAIPSLLIFAFIGYVLFIALNQPRPYTHQRLSMMIPPGWQNDQCVDNEFLKCTIHIRRTGAPTLGMWLGVTHRRGYQDVWQYHNDVYMINEGVRGQLVDVFSTSVSGYPAGVRDYFFRVNLENPDGCQPYGRDVFILVEDQIYVMIFSTGCDLEWDQLEEEIWEVVDSVVIQ
ncbi:MAG: hypothetical protein MUF87_09010 [Anaerolineae bacterium]|jgi:hypothetical protein|nr:hypothetical protein [Anaerolineae bacterium]